MDIQSGMTYQKYYNGKVKTYTVEKVGPVVTERSCWGKCHTQYVWVKCCDGIESALSYETVKENIKINKEKKCLS